MQLHYSNTKRAEKRDDTAHFNDIIPHSNNRLWCKHEVLVDEVRFNADIKKRERKSFQSRQVPQSGIEPESKS